MKSLAVDSGRVVNISEYRLTIPNIIPEPAGLKEASIRPGQAFYSPELSEFILRYDDVRDSDEPEKMLMDFLQSTYEAGANLAHWDREALER